MRGIEQEVEKKLRKDQESKTFKDAGRRVGGSKKEKSAYKNLIRLSDLYSLEEDAVTASEMVVKDKVYPKVDPEAERERGVSPGAAFLKQEIRAAFPQKPKLNTKEGRRTYISFVEFLLKDLDKCLIVKDLDNLSLIYRNLHGAEMLFLFEGGHLSQYSDEKLNEILHEHLVRRALKELFGITFWNLFHKESPAAIGKWKTARSFEGVSAEKASENVFQWNKTYQGVINYYVPRIELYKTYSFAQLAEQRKTWKGVSKDLEVFRREAIRFYEDKVQKAEKQLNQIPEDQKEHPPTWEWTGKKDRKEPVKKVDIQINSGVPLSFIKRTGGLEITTVSEEEIIELFGVTGVEFGNYMRDNESKEHVRHFLGAFADLFEVLNFNAIQINQMNSLAISFGSRGHGKAMATYNTARRIINLTKSRGDGTVAHEWAHFLDNLISHQLLTNGGSAHNLATGHVNRLKDGEIKKALEQLMEFIYKGYGFERTVKKTFYPQSAVTYANLKGETLEKSLERVRIRYRYLFNEYPKYVKDQNKVFGYLALAHDLPSIEVELTTSNKSLYYYYSSQLNAYWREPWELFARAFETYIFDKLDKTGRANNYLVSGGNFDHSSKVYPFGEEREVLFRYYDALMTAIKKELGIKDFEPFTNVRTNEYIQFDENSEEEKVTGGVIVASTLSELLLLEMEFFKLN